MFGFKDGATAHTFYASLHGPRNFDFLGTMRFMTMQEKNILTRAIEIEKENWG